MRRSSEDRRACSCCLPEVSVHVLSLLRPLLGALVAWALVLLVPISLIFYLKFFGQAVSDNMSTYAHVPSDGFFSGSDTLSLRDSRPFCISAHA